MPFETPRENILDEKALEKTLDYMQHKYSFVSPDTIKRFLTSLEKRNQDSSKAGYNDYEQGNFIQTLNEFRVGKGDFGVFSAMKGKYNKELVKILKKEEAEINAAHEGETELEAKEAELLHQHGEEWVEAQKVGVEDPDPPEEVEYDEETMSAAEMAEFLHLHGEEAAQRMRKNFEGQNHQ